MSFEFRNLQTGRVCCSSSKYPPRLCPACLEQFKQVVGMNTEANRNSGAVLSRPSALTVAAAAPRQLTPAQQSKLAEAHAIMAANAAAAVPSINALPEPPSLVAAIAARRSESRMPIGSVPEPVFFGGGPRLRPTVAISGEVPEPPSLTDAIRNRRTR